MTSAKRGLDLPVRARNAQSRHFQSGTQKSAALRRRHWPCDQEALNRAAVLLRQKLPLLLRFHAFSDDFQPEGSAQRDGRPAQRRVVGVHRAILHQ
jgi:hypothetical protein